MSETWVVNASPLIVLAKIGRMDLLEKMATILIPTAVRAEILAGPADDPARQALEFGWGEEAMLDDAQARACAATIGLPVIGTIGAVLRAKALGLLSAAGPICAELQSVGLRIDAVTMQQALKSVGEG